MAWPFPNPKPLGWGLFEALTSVQMSQVNANAAAAADGAAWTDITSIKSWKRAQPAEPDAVVVSGHVYEPVRRRWFSFGSVAGAGMFTWTISGEVWMPTVFLPSSGGIALGTIAGAWANAAGVLLVGGAPQSASTAKLRESTDGGVNWTARNIGASNTQTIGEIAYSESLALWFASVGGNAGEGLFSSPDRVTWTLRAAAGGAPLWITVRDAPSPIIIGTLSQSVGSTTGYFRSVNGTAWTTETFPVTLGSSHRPCWSDALGKFFVVSSSGIYSSSTGLTGSWTLVDATYTTGGIAAYGRLLIRGDGKVSADAGVTWAPVIELADTDLTPRAYTGVGVLLKRAASRELYLSLLVGS